MDEIDELMACLKNLFDSLENESDYSGQPLPMELCKEMNCLGTPEEIAGLINAGYGRVLHPVRVMAVAANKGDIIASKRIPMVQLMSDKNGCVMHKDGKCLLWQSGLTPMMGRMHLLFRGDMRTKALKFLFHLTVMEWLNPANESDILFCLKSLDRIDEKIDGNHTN